MLESMRNQAQSWIAKLILGGIVLSFALWGIGDYFMGSQVEYVAEVDGKPAGVSIAIPNINEVLHKMNGSLFPLGWLRFLLGFRRIKRVRVIIMGVVKEYRKRGIDAVFYVDTFNKGKKLGFTEGEMGWILEDNDIMNRSIEMFGGRLYRRYRLYEKPIAPAK